MGRERNDEKADMGMDGGQPELGPSTRLLIAEDRYDPTTGQFNLENPLPTGPVTPSIHLSSTERFENCMQGELAFARAYGLGTVEALEAELRRQGIPIEAIGIYARLSNDNMHAVEVMSMAMEPGSPQYAWMFPAGMAAINMLSRSCVRPRNEAHPDACDVIVHGDSVYGGTHALMHAFLPNDGLITVDVDMRDLSALRKVLEQYKERVGLVFYETPTNPTLKMVDIQGVSNVLNEVYPGGNRPVHAVDNTFMGIFQDPLLFGADVVAYSATKYIGGHSDLIAGINTGRINDGTRLTPLKLLDKKDYDLPLGASMSLRRTVTGGNAAAFTAWQIQRSLKTYYLRMREQAKTTMQVAGALQGHPKLANLTFPGLFEPGSREHDIYQMQCSGPSAIIHMTLKEDTREAAYRFGDALKIVERAVSLGCGRALLDIAAYWTHSDVPLDEQAKIDITPSGIRLSIGLEDAADLVWDLEQALEHV